jgi:3-hydroxyacyl-[acyl-carrier-protein] dehydratase
LLVDRVVELEPGEKAVGIKNVTVNEPYFNGHFPGNPIMPGVLIIEALAQVGAVCILSVPENSDKLALFAGIDRMRFREQVVPGDQLRLEVDITRMREALGKGAVTALVDGAIAAEGVLMFVLEEESNES